LDLVGDIKSLPYITINMNTSADLSPNSPHTFRIKDGFSGQRMLVLPARLAEAFAGSELYFTDMGYFPQAKFHYIDRVAGCGEYILIYCSGGRGEIEIDGKVYELRANCFCIIPPATPHRYCSSGEEPWTIYWLHFNGCQAGSIFGKYSQKGEFLVKELAYEPGRIAFFDHLLDVADQGFSARSLDYVNMSLGHLLASFLYPQLTCLSSPAQSDAVSLAVSFMKNKLSAGLSMNELAAAARCSASHLHALFKQQTGYSPLQYFNHIKVRQSCQYLSFSSLTIKEISLRLGMNDPLYFSRLFKKSMGISPVGYRKKFKQLR
jgi:AraC-like DNA-binding protein